MAGRSPNGTAGGAKPRRAAGCRATIVAITLVAAACGPTVGPEPGGAPAPARTGEVRLRDAVAAGYAEGSYRYEITLSGSVESRGGAVASRGTAAIRSGSYVTVHATPRDGGAQLRVTVDSFVVQRAEPRIPAPEHGELGHHTYDVLVHPDGRTERLTSAALGCPGRSPMEGTMQSVIVPLPADLRIGSRWEDSVVTVSCRDALPITTVHVHRYTALGSMQRGGARLMRVRRETESRIEGSAVRRGQAVGLTGSGRDRAELTVDPATGALVESQGTSNAEMSLRGAEAEGEVALRQRVTVRVRRVE